MFSDLKVSQWLGLGCAPEIYNSEGCLSAV